jgi:hypothetical protein
MISRLSSFDKALGAVLTFSESSDHLCALFHHPKLSQHPSNAVLNGIIRLTFPLVLRSYLSHKACNWGFVRALSAASLMSITHISKVGEISFLDSTR